MSGTLMLGIGSRTPCRIRGMAVGFFSPLGFGRSLIKFSKNLVYFMRCSRSGWSTTGSCSVIWPSVICWKMIMMMLHCSALLIWRKLEDRSPRNGKVFLCHWLWLVVFSLGDRKDWFLEKDWRKYCWCCNGGGFLHGDLGSQLHLLAR